MDPKRKHQKLDMHLFLIIIYSFTPHEVSHVALKVLQAKHVTDAPFLRKKVERTGGALCSVPPLHRFTYIKDCSHSPQVVPSFATRDEQKGVH